MSNDLERYLIQKASLEGTPIKATLELTPLCNMNCRMCYIHHSQSEATESAGVKPGEYWENLIPEMKELGILFVALIGGEPFLYPGLQSLYEKLYKNGFYINITTNATLLSEKIPEWLISIPPRYMTVSLYGASDNTYEKVTGNPRGFTQTIKGLEGLLQAKIPVKLNYVIVPENKNDLDAVFKIKEKYHLPILATSYCFPQTRRKKKSAYVRLSAGECAAEELHIAKLNKPDKYQKWIYYLAERNYKQDTVKHTERMYCHAGRSTFWISWKGDMMPCGMIDNISIKTCNGRMKETWEELKRQTAGIRSSYKCAKCENREICQVCPAIMEAETGSMESSPNYLCEITDEMIRLGIEENKKFS